MKIQIAMKMRVLICSLVFASAMWLNPVTYGQTYEKSRTVTETFKVWPDTEIEVNNKYGTIHLIHWDKDSVRFEIELMVRGSKESRVDKSFDFIEFDFKPSKFYVIAQTLFSGKSGFWSDVSDITSSVFNSNTKTKIDYTIYLPEDASLKILNKYGNVYTTNHSGRLHIELSNGDLKAHHLSGRTNITNEFGNVNIKQIDDGSLNINYGELEIENAGNLSVESKSSKFFIDEVADLYLNSRRDKFSIKKAGSIHGVTNFTGIKVDELDQKINLTTKYGDVDIKSFSDYVESIDIKSVDTDITLHFTDPKQYELDILVNDKTQVMYSADITNIISRQLDDKENLIEVKCIVGNNKTRIVPVKLDSRGGSLSLKLK